MLLLAAFYLSWRVVGGDFLETRLGALMPLEAGGAELSQLLEQFGEQSGSRLFFLLEGPNPTELVTAGQALHRALLDSGRFEPAPQPADWLDFLTQSPWTHLPQAHQQALNSPDPVAALTSLGEAALASPFGPLGDPAQDPFLTIPARAAQWSQAIPPGEVLGPLRLLPGPALVFELSITHSAFDYAATRLDAQVIEKQLAKLQSQASGLSLRWIGLSRYADRSAALARSEMNWIGGFSLLGILALVYGSFGSLRLLGLALLALGSGLLLALAGSLWVFGSLHVITLVFGASLTGVAIDYAFHSFTQSQVEPRGTLRGIRSALLLGMGSSVLAYLALGLAPFAGLRQVALFSALGLLGSMAAVFWLLPGLMPQSPGLVDPLPQRLGRWWLARFEGWRPRWVAAAILLLAAPGWLMLQSNDDVALLAPRPADLVADEAAMAQKIPQLHLGSFFMVQAPDPQSLSDRLGALQAKVPGRSLHDFWLGPQRQEGDLRRLRSAWNSGYRAQLAHWGWEPELLERYQQHLAQAQPVGLDQLPQKGLWIKFKGQFYAPLLPSQPPTDEDLAAVRQLAGVNWVDQRGQASRLLQRYREEGTWLLLGAYSLIAGLLVVRYGWRRGLWVIMPPLVAAGSLLGLMGWLGFPLNLFHLLGLVLVLGVGIDHSLFFAEAQEQPEKVWMAVMLSAATSLLAFGLLSFSQTGALSALGLVTGWGVALALIFSPLAGQRS
ncbi:MAG: hypothetical protein RRB13_11015 [bacterium]|nr:hypothetical protein [bacterium]